MKACLILVLVGVAMMGPRVDAEAHNCPVGEATAPEVKPPEAVTAPTDCAVTPTDGGTTMGTGCKVTFAEATKKYKLECVAAPTPCGSADVHPAPELMTETTTTTTTPKPTAEGYGNNGGEGGRGGGGGKGGAGGQAISHVNVHVHSRETGGEHLFLLSVVLFLLSSLLFVLSFRLLHHFRDIRENDQQHMNMIPRGITGCAYKMKGLEAILNEDAKEIKGEPRVKNWWWDWDW